MVVHVLALTDVLASMVLKEGFASLVSIKACRHLIHQPRVVRVIFEVQTAMRNINKFNTHLPLA